MSEESPLLALFYVTLNVIILQWFGYLLRATGVLTDEAKKGIGIFIGFLALPALFFHSLATMDVWSVPLPVLSAALSGKLCMLVIAYFLGAAKAAAFSTPGSIEMRGGIIGLLATNGDELGLGLPALGAMFSPQLVSMLFVLAGFQKMLINVFAFVLLGVGAAKRDAAKTHDGAPPPSSFTILAAVLRAKVKDQLVIAIFVGLAYNLIFAGLGGALLPPPLEKLTQTLSGGFSPCIFVLAGAASVGTFSKLASLGTLPMALTTTVLKSLILPVLIRSLVYFFGGDKESMDFAFAYGMLPAAGSTLVFAMPYGPSARQMTFLNATLALSKIVAFPLLLLVSAVLFASDDVVPNASPPLRKLAALVTFGCQLVSCVTCGLTLASRLWWHAPRPHVTLLLLLGLECAFLICSLAGSLLVSPYSGVRRANDALASSFRWALWIQLLTMSWAHLSHLSLLSTQAQDPQLIRTSSMTMRGKQLQQHMDNKTAGDLIGPTRGGVPELRRSHSSRPTYHRLEDEEEGPAPALRRVKSTDADDPEVAAVSIQQAWRKPRGDARTPELSSHASTKHVRENLGIAMAGGLLMTVPSCLAPMPEPVSYELGIVTRIVSHVDSWLPRTDLQARVLTLGYASVALALLWALLALLTFSSTLNLKARNERYLVFVQGHQILLSVAVTHLALSAAVMATARHTELLGIHAFTTLLSATLESLFGLLLFLLHGRHSVADDFKRTLRALQMKLRACGLLQPDDTAVEAVSAPASTDESGQEVRPLRPDDFVFAAGVTGHA